MDFCFKTIQEHKDDFTIFKGVIEICNKLFDAQNLMNCFVCKTCTEPELFVNLGVDPTKFSNKFISRFQTLHATTSHKSRVQPNMIG